MKDWTRPPQSPDIKPIPRVAVRVWLADGTRMLGMWTGTRWWSTKGEIHPVTWEPRGEGEEDGEAAEKASKERTAWNRRLVCL
jgi:hypothetical protein